MTGLLPYLKSLYGDSVESYFSPGAVGMQSKQRWDHEKGGVIGEDDEFITSASAEDSWWDEDDVPKDGKQATQRITIDAKNVVSREVPDAEDNNSLPSLHTKADDVEECDGSVLKDLLNAPPPMRRTIANDESTISSNITMDTRMDTVEDTIGSLHNSVNHMTHEMMRFMKSMEQRHGLRQGSHQAPANYQPAAGDTTPIRQAAAVSTHAASTKVTEDNLPSDQVK